MPGRIQGFPYRLLGVGAWRGAVPKPDIRVPQSQQFCTRVNAPETDSAHSAQPVVLLGNANVGKSALFGALSGRYVSVSNYPGTTVEVASGVVGRNGSSRALLDTPGIQSLHAVSPDEVVTRNIVLSGDPGAVLLVIDAKNLQRGLLLALEAGEAGIPIVVALNMADEADRKGIEIDVPKLSALLGVPVVRAVAPRREGIEEIRTRLGHAAPIRLRVEYPPAVERAVERVGEVIGGSRPASRLAALLSLAGDDALLTDLSVAGHAEIAVLREALGFELGLPAASVIQRARLEAARRTAAEVLRRRPTAESLPERLARLAIHPAWGWPILGLVLYAVYLFVGVFGAGTLVDFFEETVFGGWINPVVTSAVTRWIPIPLIADFLVGDYGVVTMALTYSVAIVLPIVSTFFLAFSLLEDSGYLPRLAVMLDRPFRRMGLNGKAVLPMILGLGCDTMATMTTRILETRKERIQVTLLLALGVPCSAQLGVLLGMMAGLSTAAIAVWAVVIVGTMVAVGALAARLLPGTSSDFILELPPLRRPGLVNITLKTLARVEWYLKEVIPVFVIGTAILFALAGTGALSVIQEALSPLVVGWLGLPVEATEALLVGFLRRDYGAAGLFAMARTGGLDFVQITVSLVVVTLFMPCIANVLMIVKEYGSRVALAVVAVVFPLAFLMGGLVRLFFQAFPGLFS